MTTGYWWLDLLGAIAGAIVSWLHGRYSAPKPAAPTPPLPPSVNGIVTKGL